MGFVHCYSADSQETCTSKHDITIIFPSIRTKYMYPNLLDPTNFSGPNANAGFPRDVGETPGFFRKITGLEEKPGFFPIC